MSIKAALSKPFAKYIRKKLDKLNAKAVESQQEMMQYLLKNGKNTLFGKEHQFEKISDYEEFKQHIPVVDYEQLKPYIEKILQGEKDVLWPGKPNYLSKTSGTTSGTKYIPNTPVSLKHQLDAARNAILCYIAETGKTDFIDGKMIFLQGSPELEEKNGIKIGRLSGIVAHRIPAYLQKNRLRNLFHLPRK